MLRKCRIDPPQRHVRKHPWLDNFAFIVAPRSNRRPREPLAPASQNTVTVSLGEVLPLLADAVASQRTWLGDFEDDEITISADLYEVLLAYQYFRNPAA